MPNAGTISAFSVKRVVSAVVSMGLGGRSFLMEVTSLEWPAGLPACAPTQRPAAQGLKHMFLGGLHHPGSRYFILIVPTPERACGTGSRPSVGRSTGRSLLA